MWTVAETATRDVVTVTPETTVADCYSLMQERGLRHLPVVDEERKPVALVTDERVMGLYRRELDESVALAASEPPEVVVDQNADLKPTLEKMLAAHQAALLLDDEGRLAGIFTEHDAVRLAETALSLDLKVGDIAQTQLELLTIPLGSPAHVARMMMLENRTRHVLVTTPKGRLAGVIAQRDLTGLVETRIDQHMNAIVHTVSPDDDLHNAISAMVRHAIGSLPVVGDDHTPIGVITRTDVIRAVVNQLD